MPAYAGRKENNPERRTGTTLGIPIVTVDAFTETRFSGNPAAVCLLPPGKADEDWMQKVAMEMNLSETAFLRSRDGKSPKGQRGAQGARVLRPALVYTNR